MNGNKKSGFFLETVKPVAVLVSICLAVAALLGVTNAVTAPIIDENERVAALETRRELLPLATGFSERAYPSDGHVTGVFVDDGGSGMIVEVGMTGYGGIVGVTVAIDPAGTVLEIRVDADTETKGIGSRVADAAFTGLFTGLSSTDGVDVIAGATYSARTVIDSVALALSVFESTGGIS